MSMLPSALGLAGDEVHSLLTAAGQAPSVHNTQPWLFRLTPDVIELHADPTRRLDVADPDGHELLIGCGAALFNLRIALSALGIRPTVTMFPDRDRADLVAVVRNGGHKAPLPEILRLRRAIPLRHTNRRPFTDTPVSVPHQHALRRAALDEGSWLHMVTDHGERAELGRLAAEAHRVQMSDPCFRSEFAAWTGTADGRRDGVPATAGAPLPEPHDTWVHRDFTAGLGRSRAPGKDYEEEPLVGILTSHTGGPAADVRAGQALQRILLTATDSGLAVSFLSQLTEVVPIREQVRRLIRGTRRPQAVLRIGHGWPVTPTPRLTVAELVRTDAARPS